MKVYLNGNSYELLAGTKVTRQPLIEFGAHIRTVGQQKREDRTLISSWNINKWNRGLGVQYMDIDSERDKASIWESTADTRFPGQITNAAEPVAVSVVPSINIRHYCITKDELLFFACGTNSKVAFKFTPPNSIGSYSALSGNAMESIHGAYASGDNMWFADSDVGTDIKRIFRLGGIGSTIYPIGTISASGDVRMGIFSNKLYMYGVNTAVGTRTGACFAYTDKLYTGSGIDNANYYSSGAVPTQIPRLVSDGISVYACIPEGVWDIVPTTPENIVDSTSLPDDEPLLAGYAGAIILKNYDDILGIDPSTLDIVPIGLNLDAGLSTSKSGDVTAITGSWKYLFAAIRPAIFSYIYVFTGEGWHYLATVGSTTAEVSEMFVSATPDDIPRLWLLFKGGTPPMYILNPLVNPLSAGTYNFKTTGNVTFPYYNGGMAEEPTGIYDMAISCDGVGGSIGVWAYYGINGNDASTALGTLTSSVQKLTFGAGVGIEGYRIQPKFSLKGKAGTTPVLREATLHYLKLPAERESFTFTVDLDETSSREVRPLEDVIGSLDYERGKATLMPFWYGRMATKLVKALQMPALEDSGDNAYEDERSGLVTVRVSELI